jgi:hypothetical protein
MKKQFKNARRAAPASSDIPNSVSGPSTRFGVAALILSTGSTVIYLLTSEGLRNFLRFMAGIVARFIGTHP